MRLHALRSKDWMSRRDFLKILQLESHGIPFIDKERCTGCGLCTIDCPTKALTVSPNSENDTYQLLFREDACDVCGVCEKSCPEHCLHLEPLDSNRRGKEAAVIFEDEISHCQECGIPLFPQSMVNNLESRIFGTGEPAWSFDLCPSCGIKTGFQKQMIEKVER